VSGPMDDRVVLVTGAGSGIGEAVCVRFARAGARVVATTRSPEHLERTIGRVREASRAEHLGLPLDVRDRASVDAVVAVVAERFGRVDVLCANAGIDLPHAPSIARVTDSEWDDVLAVNVTGTFLVARACVPHIPDGGSIVTIGSINSFVGWPDNVPYTTSKGAVLQFTRAIALDLAPRRIRANCVCPGIIDTPLTRAFIESADDPAAVIREYEAVSPLGRMGTAEEVANAVLFLASDEASYVTGSALLVDGGTTAIA
jgi:meso-butanediol dehydrogenase/(S,S)-butanediol dehydrogenase/diacetyl reductase